MDSRVYPLEHTTGDVNLVSPRREVRRQPTQILGHVHKQRCTSASQLQEAVNYPTKCVTERLHSRSGVIQHVSNSSQGTWRGQLSCYFTHHGAERCAYILHTVTEHGDEALNSDDDLFATGRPCSTPDVVVHVFERIGVISKTFFSGLNCRCHSNEASCAAR